MIHFVGFNQYTLLVLGILTLSSCSADPAKQKLKHLKSGEQYFKQSKYQEAVVEFRNAVQIDPRSADAHYQLARAYISLRNSQGAHRELLETLALDPKNSAAQLQLAALLVTARQYDQAEAAANKVIALEPTNSKAHTILGAKHAMTGEQSSAISEFQKAIELDPKQVEYYDSLGTLYLSAGKPSAAEALHKSAIEANPKSPQARMSLGKFYLLQHQMTEAEAQAKGAIQLEPGSVAPQLFLGTIYIAQGRLPDAESLYAHLKTMAPNDPQAYQALGLFYSATGQNEKAAAEFRILLAAKPKETEVKALLIETLIDLNRVNDATNFNETVLKTNPSDPQALLSKARIFIAESKYQEALGALQNALKSDPDSASIHYFLGVTQQSLGFSDLAKTSFTEALKLNPQMPEAAVALAAIETRSGDYEKALRLAGDVLKRDPNLSLPYAVSAQAWLAKGDLQQGEILLQAALSRDPTSLPALAILLSLYVRQGRTPEAVERISKLVDHYPERASLRFLLAVGYFNMKDLEKSEASVRRVLILDPKSPDAYTLLASIDLARGLVENAKADLRMAIEINPRNITNYMALGTQFEKENNWDEAKKVFDKAHSLDPESPLIANELAYLYLEHGGDVNVSLSLAQLAKQKMPDSLHAADTLGWAYYKLGAFAPAIAQLKECAGNEPNNAVFQYHLGMAYAAAGNRDSATQALHRSLKNDPNFVYAESAKAALANISKRSD
jgi:tetratricopeptide (TPR) repeat protein